MVSPCRLPHCNLAILIILAWYSPLSQSLEICCCPDLTLSLAAVVSDTTKSLENGFMYAAKQDSTVSLTCDLGDKDHPAIKSVIYKFHKTSYLSTSKPISLYPIYTRELCSDDDGSTCDLTNVQYSEYPSKQTSLDTSDNHIYQCYAQITMVDDAVVELWSHTVKLDVYYPPTKDNRPVPSDPKSVTIGKSMEKLLCDLPDSNPKTKARWSFKKKDTSTWEVIDIPNDVRGDRLVIAQDDINGMSQDDIARGNLLIMIFDEYEDQGDYKCEGVYRTEFGDTDMDFVLSRYEVKSNGQLDNSSLLLRIVSEITEPKLVNQDSTHVNFTVYVRDTPGRGGWGNVSYTWQIFGENDQYLDLNVDDYDNLQISNHGRTLTVSDLVVHREHEFQCKIRRTSDADESTSIWSRKFGVGNSALVIAPKFLSIPLTSRTCVNHGDDLKAAPNKAYMMSTPALAGEDPKQILLKASWKFYLNDNIIQFIMDSDKNFDYEDRAGIDQDQYERKLLPANHKTRCVYWQYMRYGQQYQLFEVMKTERFENAGLKRIDFQSAVCNNTNIVRDANKVSLTFGEGASTAQCLKAELVDSNDKTLVSKRLRTTADSCATWIPQTYEFTDVPEQTGLKIKISSESCGGDSFASGSCSIDVQDPILTLCSKPIIEGGSVFPDSDISTGATYQVTCDEGFGIIGSSIVTCTNGKLSASPRCISRELARDLAAIFGQYS